MILWLAAGGDLVAFVDGGGNARHWRDDTIQSSLHLLLLFLSDELSLILCDKGVGLPVLLDLVEIIVICTLIKFTNVCLLTLQAFF